MKRGWGLPIYSPPPSLRHLRTCGPGVTVPAAGEYVRADVQASGILLTPEIPADGPPPPPNWVSRCCLPSSLVWRLRQKSGRGEFRGPHVPALVGIIAFFLSFLQSVTHDFRIFLPKFQHSFLVHLLQIIRSPFYPFFIIFCIFTFLPTFSSFPHFF